MMLVVESTTLTQVRLVQFRRDSMQKKKACRSCLAEVSSEGRPSCHLSERAERLKTARQSALICARAKECGHNH